MDTSLPQKAESSKSSEFISPDTPSKCTWKPGADPESSIHERLKFPEKPKILPNALYAIGNTPLIRLNKIPKEYGIKCEMLIKCEFFNVGGSVKDRIALKMVEDAEKQKKIKPGDTLIEPTSGNTGIGLALVSAVKGYKCIIVMPENMSDEKVNCITALGADVVRTPVTARFDDPESHFRVAQKLNQEIPNSFLLDQYRNARNPLVHYYTTAEEILEACDNKIDMIVAGAGTGGTVTGIGRKMKEACPECKIVGVMPRSSSESPSGIDLSHEIAEWEVEGIGYEFSPTVLDTKIVDEWVEVKDKDTFQMARMLIRKEGILCGGSGGTALSAALQVAKDLKEEQRCVVMIADGNRNYMSGFITDNWMVERSYMDVDSVVKVDHWWWNKPIMCLNILPPLTVSFHASCQDAVNIMNRQGRDQILVVDDDGLITGMISLKDLLKVIMSVRNISSSMVSDVQHKAFHKIDGSSSLGKLTAVLDTCSYALVLYDQPSCEEKDTECKKHLRTDEELVKLPYFLKKTTTKTSSESSADKNVTNGKVRTIGIVTRMDLINFISNTNENNTEIESPSTTLKKAMKG